MSTAGVRVFYDADADPTRLRDRVVAVIGYGSQGHAHALNLRDSGVRVIVGLRPGGASWERARAEGLDVRPIADAAAAANVVMVLVPDQEARAGARLLRVPARAEVDRRSDGSRRDGLHAAFDQRYGGVRRLHAWPQDRHRRGAGRDAAHAGRHPVRQLRARVDRRDARRRRPLPGAAPGRGRASHRARGGAAARHDAVDGRRTAGSRTRDATSAGPADEAPRSRRRAVSSAPRTLFAKLWDAHVVHRFPGGGPALLYVDLHLVHEVTSPQAFAGLRQAGRPVRRPELTVATVDHNVPTGDRTLPIEDPVSARQLDALAVNARRSGA